jgi:hypothetical protein
MPVKYELFICIKIVYNFAACMPQDLPVAIVSLSAHFSKRMGGKLMFFPMWFFPIA